eukprot:scaffold189_cov118-Isochrysis_galbana.AAC.19
MSHAERVPPLVRPLRAHTAHWNISTSLAALMLYYVLRPCVLCCPLPWPSCWPSDSNVADVDQWVCGHTHIGAWAAYRRIVVHC